MTKSTFITEWLQRAMFLLLAVSLMMGLSACSDDDGDDADDFDEEEWTEAQWAKIVKYTQMSSIIRPLAGLDELPDDWETVVYQPSIGVVTDESAQDVRSVLKTDTKSAERFFLSIIPENGLVQTSDGYIWTGEEIGSLTFRRVNTDDCFATLDVKLQQMPSLTQVRFVPESAIGANATFSGVPFYRAGDVVEDKDGINWICVRPSSGPEKKEYAYFVTFDIDKSTLKTNTEKPYYVNQNGKKVQVKDMSGTWTYGKNLAEKRIAIAAALTFAYSDGLSGLGWTDNLFYKSIDIPSVRFSGCYVVYGSCAKTDGLHSAKYIQPMILANAFSSTSLSCSSTRPDSENLLSLTDSYDPAYWSAQLWNESQVTSANWHKEGEAYEEPFDIRHYVTSFVPESRRLTLPARAYLNVADSYSNGKVKHPVFVMQQMRVKDKGKAYSGFTLVNPDTPNTFDFWKWQERGNVSLDGDSFSMNN